MKPPPPGVEGQQGGHCDGLHHPAAGFFKKFFVLNALLQRKKIPAYLAG